jgi:hypothetical protein
MADRELKMPKRQEGSGSEEEIGVMPSQQKRAETGRFLLQIDRQTKGYFGSFDEAQSVGLKIKKSYPVIHVAIYDRVDHVHTLISAPNAR